MGIFNEQSYNHPFARGIQGAPGVGFSLTSDANYDITGKKLTNVGLPTVKTDAVTKKYVDDNSSGRPRTSRLTVNSNIDMKDTFRILNLKAPSNADEPAAKQYADSHFFYRDGSHPRTGDVNMNNNRIHNLPQPNKGDQPVNLRFSSNRYLHLDGTRSMHANLDMNENTLTNLKAIPQNPKDAATKHYADTYFLKGDGSNTLIGDLNINGHRILNLRTPRLNSEVATKKYVDDNKVDGNVILKLDG